MTDVVYRSAGVSTREIDNTAATAIVPVGVPAGVIGASQKGPAFVPLTLPTINDFITTFGLPADNFRFGPMGSIEWLRKAQALTFLRVLGVGQGLARESGTNRVVNGGFIVGGQQPQNSLSGNLGNNVNAIALGTSPPSTGSAGRTFFLGCLMSASAGSTIFSDSGIQPNTTSIPVIRGVLLAASGVVVTLSSAFGGKNGPPPSTVAADIGANWIITGSHTGSVNLAGGKQEFVMLLNGFVSPSATYPNVLTASFDMTAPNYFGNVFNKDPLKLEKAGYLLYSQFDIHPSMAALTGSGLVVAASGANAPANVTVGKERSAFLITGSQASNVGTSTAPNFESFEDRFRTAHSPYVVSQKFGGTQTNLFQIFALDDGSCANGKYKISIENISPSISDVYRYGSFDLLVRDFNDNDTNRVVFESFRNLSLDPNSPRFIAKIIGDYYTFYNFDAILGSQKLVTTGFYPNQSRYIRVALTDAVQNGTVDPTTLPMGFRGPQHLVTSGTAPMSPSSDTVGGISVANPFYGSVTPPVPMRLNLNRNPSPRQIPDKTLYWGVQFETVINPLDPNIGTTPSVTLQNFSKYYPNFRTDFMNFAVEGNEGTADNTTNGIVDADRFCNNAFTLENVQIKYNTTTLVADITTLVSWSYVRTGNISPNSGNSTRALSVSDLTDPGVRSVGKFSFYLYGGFDGVNIFNNDASTLTNLAVIQEMNYSARGLSNGPTVQSYYKSLGILQNQSDFDIQVLAMPGIRHHYLTDVATKVAEARNDCLYLMDIEERDLTNFVVSSSTQELSVANTVSDFTTRAVNSNFAAAYWPDVNMRDPFTRLTVRVPPSVALLGVIAKNDAIGQPWYAPAGYTRAVLDSVNDTVVPLNKNNLDALYLARINPITSFPGAGGVVVWGQKTLQGEQTALDRVNVRRLLVFLRREIKKVANRILFEQNRDATLQRFTNLVNPILKKVQDGNGVDRFLVKIDASTTSQADVLNNTIRGKIWIQPTKTLEFLSLDFSLSNGNVAISA